MQDTSMPIVFITLSETYANSIRKHGFDAKTMKIQDYRPVRKTYYVSPANSLCFMDGGIDYALSRIVFPGIEPSVKQRVKDLGVTSLLGRPYLPIGSSIILDSPNGSSLVISPTMLLPQDVSTTRNAYYCTVAALFNVLENRGETIDAVDIVFTSFCCGYGKMGEEQSIQQILDGVREYKQYRPRCIDASTILNEPALWDQPKYYQNTEFFPVNPDELVMC